MNKLDHKDIKTWDTEDNCAVKFQEVTKTFEQWQRSGGFKNTLQNLIRPQKKTIEALQGVSFEIKRGEFTAYAGPNGAGKSTTIKLICGMLLPLKGEISVLGMSPAKNRMELMKRVGVMFGNRTELWWDHPIMQNFEWKREVWDIPKEQYKKTLAQLIELLDLQEILHTFARELSLGQRMKADLAMTLLHAPELILLDEPTIGLDVLAKRQMIAFLKELNQTQGTTILVTSHDMDDLEEMARRIILIERGRVAFDDSFGALRAAAGNHCRVLLELQAETAPVFEHATLLAQEGNRFEYAFDMNKSSMSGVLSRIGMIEGVTDVEIKKAPIEDVIAGLYLQWKK